MVLIFFMICVEEKKSKKDKKDKKDKVHEPVTSFVSSSNDHNGGDIIQPEKTASKIDTSRYFTMLLSNEYTASLKYALSNS